MAARVNQPSFSSGELSPTLFGRVDLDKYKTGCALARNFLVEYRGGLISRPGTQFIGQTITNPPNGQSRLLPFVVSTEASYIIELGPSLMRFIANGAFILSGGAPLEIASPYVEADIALVKYAQSADVMVLTHPNYPVYELTRTGASTFVLAPQVIGSSLANFINEIATVTAVNSTDTKSIYGYVITAVDSSGVESPPTLPGYTTGSILNQNTQTYNKITWPAISGAITYNIYKAGPAASGASGTTSSPAPTVFGYIGSSSSTSFTDNNIAPDFNQSPPTFTNPFAPGQMAEITVTNPGSGYTGVLVGLTFTGDGTGAQGYGVVDFTSGEVVSAVITNPGMNYTTLTAVVTTSPGQGGSGATVSITLGQESGTYPAVPGYFQQRLVLGATDNFPESLVFSKTGNYNNFDTSLISEDTDSITISLASREVNEIKSVVAMSTGLVVLTTGNGFLVSGNGQGTAITPSEIVALPQASSGANDIPPLVVNYDILYCQNRGSVVRDLAFNFYVQSYTGTDRSVISSHLFTNFVLEEWSYAEEPFRLVQVVRDDGTLLSMTYVPEQEIFGWTHSDTQGLFRSIATVPEGSVNATYVIVERYVGGSPFWYIERFNSRLWDSLADAWTVDSALALPLTFPAANITLSGVTGTINVTADAAVFAGGDVGKILWAGLGQAQVTAFVSATVVTVEILQPFAVVPNTSTPLPYASGDWSYDSPVTTVSGLDHLSGMTVTGLADGVVIPPTVVAGGAIALSAPATKVVVGLGFTCQFQTLELDVGEPTIQGKRKNIAAITVKCDETLGLQVGQSFSKMYDIKELISKEFPPQWKSINAHSLINSQWNRDGTFCLQQSCPLPARILSVTPEVVIGDTGH